MVKQSRIQIYFLSLVWVAMLASIILPHHHHEEIACFTTTHCEDDTKANNHHGEESGDHRHHNTREESQHCLSTEYYVFSDSGSVLKRSIDFVASTTLPHNFLNFCLHSTDIEPQQFDTGPFFYEIYSFKKNYTTLIKNDLPLRAPPVSLT